MWGVFVMTGGQSSILLAAALFLTRYGAIGLAVAQLLSFVVVGFLLVLFLARLMRRDLASPRPSVST